jgi:uncharacterized protein (TIRG00374 family)
LIFNRYDLQKQVFLFKDIALMPKDKSQGNKYIPYLLRFGVAGGALYLAFRGEDFGQLIEVLRRFSLWVFASALGLYIIAQLIFALRWTLLMQSQSIKIGFSPAVRLHFLGLFYTHCLPSSVGGDLLRAWYVTRHTNKKLEAALSVFIDRAIGLIGMLIMAFFCYWFIPVDGHQGRFEFPYKVNLLQGMDEYKLVFAVAGVVLAAVFAILLSSARGRGLLRHGCGFIREHGTIILRKIQDAIRIYFNKKLIIICALLLTFCLQSLCVVAMWLIGREIGITAHIKYYFIFFPLSWLLGALPISVGGAGIMELWLKDIFIRVCGVPGEHSLVLALFQRLMWLVGSLPGAVIHLTGTHLPKDFSIDDKKSIN